MIKRGLALFIAVLLSVTNINALVLSDFTIDEKFRVYSLAYDSYEEVGVFDTYKQADRFFESNKDYYNNLSIYSNGYFYKAEYAIIAFNYSDKCDYNVEFENVIDKTKNYVNGCYGSDGAYLDTNEDGSKVKFKISGVEGWAKLEDVVIYPLQLLPGRLTKYKVIENNLYHQIKHTFATDYYNSIINLGEAPGYLNNDEEYYSYDGHYFYSDDALWLMLEDYKNGSYVNSINKDDPYYNYYQYVSNRTLTSYTAGELDTYFKDVLGINGPVLEYYDLDKNSVNDIITRSQFYNQFEEFFQYQYQYGANALMMIALSMNESASGKSSLSFTRNNLFGHSAFDSDVEKNAARYLTVSSSIYSHARYYISGSYCNPSRFQYHGCYFGNKSSGMNVSYASDPYWGEKAAQNYYNLDNYLGSKDLNKYTIGIKTNDGEVEIHQFPDDTSEVLFKTSKQPDISFVILDEVGDWYKIQSDAVLNEEGKVENNHYYDYNLHVAYIHKDSVQVILNEGGYVFDGVKVTFDAGEGIFRDQSNIVTYNIERGNVPVSEEPTLGNHLFVGWDTEIGAVENDVVYTAVYKEVASIEMLELPKTEYEINDRINLLGGKILVNFIDGTSEEVGLNTGMVSDFDFKVEGDQDVLVSYGGKTTSYKINVSVELDNVRLEINDEMNNLINDLSDKELSDEDVARVLAFKEKVDGYDLTYISHDNLRKIDKIILKAIGDKIDYIVKDKNIDISGLGLSVKLENSLDKKYLKDRIKIGIKKTEINEKLSKIAEGYNYTVLEGYEVYGKKNSGDLKLNGPVLISIEKPEGATDNQLFTVLLLQGDEVIDLYSTQTSSSIKFMLKEFGEILVVAKNTTNIYDIEDVGENINYLNSDRDIMEILTYAGGGLAFILLLIILWRFRKK